MTSRLLAFRSSFSFFSSSVHSCAAYFYHIWDRMSDVKVDIYYRQARVVPAAYNGKALPAGCGAMDGSRARQVTF